MSDQSDHPASSGRLRALLRRVSLDVSPLRESRDYRLLWAGQTVSSLGSSLAMVAIPYQVYKLTGSPLAVGLLGATELVPLFVLSILGGAIADASDRRVLMRRIKIVQAIVSGILAWQAFVGPSLWILYVLSAVQAGMFGLSGPARRSWAPRLVRPDQLSAVAALESTAMTSTHLLGPALGGVALATIGIGATYLLDAASFLVAFAAASAMRPSPPSEHAPSAGFQSVLEGIRFLKGRKVLQGGLVIDLNAMVFGMPKALFPAVAATLGGGPKVLGLLYAAPWAGAFVATATSAWVSHIRRQGLGVAIAVVGWGLSIAAFGIAGSVPVAILALAAAGFSDAISAILRTAIVQEVTPDHLRGRLSGIEIAVYAGGPTLGDVEAGVVAGLTSVRFSIVSGGLACIAGAVAVAAAMPAFLRYDRSVHRKTVDEASSPA